MVVLPVVIAYCVLPTQLVHEDFLSFGTILLLHHDTRLGLGQAPHNAPLLLAELRALVWVIPVGRLLLAGVEGLRTIGDRVRVGLQ